MKKCFLSKSVTKCKNLIIATLMHFHILVSDLRCDTGYTGAFCVPATPLPMMLRDDFNKPRDRTRWPELYGGDVNDLCDVISDGSSLNMYQVLRSGSHLFVTFVYVGYSFKYHIYFC